MKYIPLLLLVGYLGLYNGHLALWQESCDVPETVLPYNVQSFPQADQNALKKGIPFKTEAELNRLLEDFLS